MQLCNANLSLLTKDLIHRKFELHLSPYSRKENDSIEVDAPSDIRYCPSSVFDIIYFRYYIRTYFTKKGDT